MLFGFSLNAQQKDTLSFNQKLHYSPRQLYVPGAMIGAGLLAETQTKRNEYSPAEAETKDLFGFTNHADDYLQYLPYATVFGLEAIGIPSRTDAGNQLAIFLKSDALALAATYVLKVSTKKPRPDGTAYSFPSGHTANAFAGATMLSLEYRESLPWIPYVAYGVASGVGAMRISNNKHYLSDILVGAGIGILSTKIVYWTHQYRWGKPKNRENKLAGVLY